MVYIIDYSYMLATPLALLIRPPGTVVPGGRMFYCRCFFLSFLFFHREISELRRPIVKLWHVVGSVFSFIIQVPKFASPPPQKKKSGGEKRAKFLVI